MIPRVPTSVNERLTEQGGRADNGLPLFRIIRGCDRFTWIGGRWNIFDEHGNKTGERIGCEHVLKHPEAKDRYLFEILCPPENYGTEVEWVEKTVKWIDGQLVATQGPYPRQGEYELVKVLEREYTNSKGIVWKREFVPLTMTIVDALIATAKANLNLPQEIRIEARRREFEADEKRRKQNIENKFQEIEEKAASGPRITVPTEFEVSKFA